MNKRGVAVLGIVAIVLAVGVFAWMSSDLIKGGVQLSDSGFRPLYGFFNPTTGDHAYTILESVKNGFVNSKGYNYEGVAMYISFSGGADKIPLYECSNSVNGDRLYTVWVSELQALHGNGGWRCYSSSGDQSGDYNVKTSPIAIGYLLSTQKPGSVPVYRLYQDPTKTAGVKGDHGISINGGNPLNCDPNVNIGSGFYCEGIIGYAYVTLDAANAATATPPATPPATTTVLVDGSFDGISSDCSYVSGWACNPNNPSITLNVQAMSFSAGGGAIMERVGDVSVPANIPREEAVAARCGGNGARGFKISLPSDLENGVVMKVYSLREGERYSELPLSGTNNIINCRAASPTPPATPPATVQDTSAYFKGNFDSVTCSSISGWVCDTRNSDGVVDIQAHSPIGNVVATGQANQPAVSNGDKSGIINWCGGSGGAHRFSIATPDSLKDGEAHVVFIYPLGDVNANNQPVPITNLQTGDITVQTISGCGGTGTTGDVIPLTPPAAQPPAAAATSKVSPGSGEFIPGDYNIDTCNGCQQGRYGSYNPGCYGVSYRFVDWIGSGKYCSSTNEWTATLGFHASCTNDYECKSNICGHGNICRYIR